MAICPLDFYRLNYYSTQKVNAECNFFFRLHSNQNTHTHTHTHVNNRSTEFLLLVVVSVLSAATDLINSLSSTVPTIHSLTLALNIVDVRENRIVALLLTHPSTARALRQAPSAVLRVWAGLALAHVDGGRSGSRRGRRNGRGGWRWDGRGGVAGLYMIINISQWSIGIARKWMKSWPWREPWQGEPGGKQRWIALWWWIEVYTSMLFY